MTTLVWTLIEDEPDVTNWTLLGDDGTLTTVANASGLDTVVAIIGAVGATGATGATGAAGADGADGVDGATILTGSGAPSDGTGNNGDLYFRTDTDEVYQKSGGTWGAAIADLTGDTGATGATGPQGDPGGPLADGDYGDITVSSSGTVFSIDAPLGVAKGGTGTTTQFTAGSVLFAGSSGVYSQDNSNLFWDDTNNRLGVGSATPDGQLTVKGSTNPLVNVEATDAAAPKVQMKNDQAHTWHFGVNGGVDKFTFAKTGVLDAIILDNTGANLLIEVDPGASGTSSFKRGKVKVSNGNILAFGDSAAADGLRIGITGGSNAAFINQANNSTLTLMTNGSTAVTIAADHTVTFAAGAAFTGDITVPDEAYGAGWNGSVEAPTKNALYDKIETLGSGGGWTEIASTTTTGAGPWSFTSIPQTYAELMVWLNVTKDASGTTLVINLSGDNGSTWTGNFPITGSGTNKTEKGMVLFPRYTGDLGIGLSNIDDNNTTDVVVSPVATIANYFWRVDGGFDALRIAIVAGNLSATNIKLYGR